MRDEQHRYARLEQQRFDQRRPHRLRLVGIVLADHRQVREAGAQNHAIHLAIAEVDRLGFVADAGAAAGLLEGGPRGTRGLLRVGLGGDDEIARHAAERIGRGDRVVPHRKAGQSCADLAGEVGGELDGRAPALQVDDHDNLLDGHRSVPSVPEARTPGRRPP
jgi:hypothetical protein